MIDSFEDLQRLVDVVNSFCPPDTGPDNFDGIYLAFCGAWHKSPLVLTADVPNAYVCLVDLTKSIRENVLRILDELESFGYDVKKPDTDFFVEE